MTDYFKLLDRFAGLPEEELLGQFTTSNVEALRLLSGLLKEEPDMERIISEKRFIQIVRELSEVRRIWSHRLEQTLAHAAREYEQGNRLQSLWILNGFIRFCPSLYYRELAEDVMREYEEEPEMAGGEG